MVGPVSFPPAAVDGLGVVAVVAQALQVDEVVEAATVGYLPDVIDFGGRPAASDAPVVVTVKCLGPGRLHMVGSVSPVWADGVCHAGL